MSLDELRVLPVLFLFFFVAVAESLFLLLVVGVVAGTFLSSLPSSSFKLMPPPSRGSVVVLGLGLLLPPL